MKQYRVGYGDGRVKMQFADLAGSLLVDIWHWKCSHCQIWHPWLKCTCTLINSIQPGPAPSYVIFNTAWHHFCLLPNTAIECWCPNLWWDLQTMLKVKFHQAGVVCPVESSCNMSGYCSVKSTALRFNSTLSLVFTLSVLSIAQATASRSPAASSLFSYRSSSSKLLLRSRPAVVLVATAVSSLQHLA